MESITTVLHRQHYSLSFFCTVNVNNLLLYHQPVCKHCLLFTSGNFLPYKKLATATATSRFSFPVPFPLESPNCRRFVMHLCVTYFRCGGWRHVCTHWPDIRDMNRAAGSSTGGAVLNRHSRRLCMCVTDVQVEKVLAQAKSFCQHLNNSCSTYNILNCIHSKNITTMIQFFCIP